MKPIHPILRTPLGEGWYLVSDPADLLDEDNPEATLIRLEGPGATDARFPFDRRYEAMAALGIRRKRRWPRRRPGPDPTDWHRRLAPTIEALYRQRRRAPLQREVAAELHVDERTLATWLRELREAGLPWRVMVRGIVELVDEERSQT